MNVLVTGGAGFIGSHLVDALCAAGHQVVVIDSLDHRVWPDGQPDYLNPEARYLFHDLRDGVPWSDLRYTEIVIHCAAYGGVGRAESDPDFVRGGNIEGTKRLVRYLRTWRRLEHVIVAGSFSVYGSGYTYYVPSTGRYLTGDRRASDLAVRRFDVYDPETGEAATIVPITEAARPAPLELYGESKLHQERWLRTVTHLPVTVLRFSSVYGPRLRVDDGEATIIAKLIGWIQKGESPNLFEDGLQGRDWVYVGDIVEAIQQIVAGEPAPPLMNVCSGQLTTLIEACALINQALGTCVDPIIVDECRRGDMRDCVGDTTLLRSLLGRPPTPFSVGLAQTLGNAVCV